MYSGLERLQQDLIGGRDMMVRDIKQHRYRTGESRPCSDRAGRKLAADRRVDQPGLGKAPVRYRSR